jgi:hypothetical protein
MPSDASTLGNRQCAGTVVLGKSAVVAVVNIDEDSRIDDVDFDGT